MLWLAKNPLTDCLRAGPALVVSTAFGVGMTCSQPLPPPPLAPQPVAQTLSTLVEKPPDLLPSVKPIAMPLEVLPPPVDCAVEACLALTFDDGPDARTTPALLDTLAAEDVRVTFFMLGSQAVKYPDIVKRVEREGHEIGNHSWGHANFTKMTPEQMAADIAHTQEMFQSIGVEPPTLFRPPYGARNPTVQQTVPLSIVLWNVDPKDWQARDAYESAARVIASVKRGGIVVMHDIKPLTVAAAPQFISTLKQTYRLVTVSQLLGLTPTTPKGEFLGR